MNGVDLIRVYGVPKLAKQLRLTRDAIYKWKTVPSSRLLEIEKKTGIPRRKLRPDLYGEGS